jgi:hypothetical protein
MIIIASLTAPYYLKASNFIPNILCTSEHCTTIAKLTRCLITDKEYAQFEGGPFFKKNPDGTYMQRITNVTVALSTKTAEGSDATFEKPITIPIIVNVISPGAFIAFQRIAYQNPKCMEAFCRNNCLLIQKMDPLSVKNQVKYFDSQSKIIIGGVVYRSPEIPVNRITGDDKVPAIDMWEGKTPEEKNKLAENYLIDQANNITSMRCLSETDGGVKLRMFCSQCALGLQKGEQGLLSKTCTSFDASRNVGYGLELAELNEGYQQELGRARLEQERKIQQDALMARDPNITDTYSYATFSDMSSQFSAKLPGFFNPGKENRTPLF